jgi:multidrug efflux system membrane fusion protein
LARILLGLAVLAVVAGLIWLAVHLTHQDGGGFGRRGGRPATTVGVATATTADIPITIDGLGTVTPAATVTVTPQVSGVITQILFREGQTVKKGQALAIIDPRPLRNQLTQAQGQLTRDEAQLANARLLLARDRTLLAQDSIARQEVDTQAATVRQLEGTVTTDRGAVAQARLNLGFSRVTAPVSGRVGLRVVDVGNYVNAGSSTGLVVITQVTPIDVEFTVPQDDVPRIAEQATHGRLPVIAFDRTRTVQLDRGVFSTLDNQIDTTTGTVRAKARFANAAGRLFPNQFVNIRMQLESLKGAVTVPVTAVRTGPDGDFVWKLNPDRTVTRRKVTRGPGTAQAVSITRGLSAGEQVITEGGDRLTEGARVNLPGERGGSAMQACAADMKKLCAGQEGREAMRCLRQHQADASPACKAAIAKAPRRQRPRGG